MQEIPYGHRRYGLMVALFGVGGVGFIIWGQSVEKPMFLFPFGRVSPETAAVVLPVIGVATLLYLAALSYVRFFKRPKVLLKKTAVVLPFGEFAQHTVTLRRDAVFEVEELPKRTGGWRTLRIRHQEGVTLMYSSQLPDDKTFELIADHVRKLLRSAEPAPNAESPAET
jgi:hypothetical protein